MPSYNANYKYVYLAIKLAPFLPYKIGIFIRYKANCANVDNVGNVAAQWWGSVPSVRKVAGSIPILDAIPSLAVARSAWRVNSDTVSVL